MEVILFYFIKRYVVRAAIFIIIIRAFLAKVLLAFSHLNLNFSTHYTFLAKVVSKRKLICYLSDDKPLKLVYFPMLIVFPYKAHIIIHLNAVKVKPAAVCLTFGLSAWLAHVIDRRYSCLCRFQFNSVLFTFDKSHLNALYMVR